jgi:hypothetical protein
MSLIELQPLPRTSVVRAGRIAAMTYCKRDRQYIDSRLGSQGCRAGPGTLVPQAMYPAGTELGCMWIPGDVHWKYNIQAWG